MDTGIGFPSPPYIMYRYTHRTYAKKEVFDDEEVSKNISGISGMDISRRAGYLSVLDDSIDWINPSPAP